MKVLIRAILWVAHYYLIVRFTIEGVIFWYRFRIANGREEYLQRLVDCMQVAFRNVPACTKISCRTQPVAGYLMDDATGKRVSEICWGAPVAITIYVHDQPMLGMSVEFRGPHICIMQLQGAHGAHIPGELMNWPELFVHGVMTFLYNTQELVSVRLYAAHHRWSYKYPDMGGIEFGENRDEILRAHQDRLRHRYDHTAELMGFTRSSRHYFYWRAPKMKTQTAN